MAAPERGGDGFVEAGQMRFGMTGSLVTEVTL